MENKPNLGGNTSLIHLPGVLGERLLLPPFFFSIQYTASMRFSHQEFFMCGFGLAFLHQPNNIKVVKMILIGFVNDLKFFHFFYNNVINLRVNSFEL